MTVLKHRIRLEMEKTWAVRSPFFYKLRLIFIQHGHAMSCFFSPTLTSWKIFVARMVQRQLRVWLLQDVCLWTCSWCYTIFCSLYVSLFIANLNGQDHWRLSSGEIQRSKSQAKRNLLWIELSPPIWGTCFLSFFLPIIEKNTSIYYKRWR